MKKYLKLLIIITIVMSFIVSCSDKSNISDTNDVNASNPVLSNNIFRVEMPQVFDGLYETTIKENAINIFDKECKEEGYDALAFSIYLLENPEDWANGPCEKVGEVTLKDGKLYDVVLSYPTEAQYGFDRQMPIKYKNLYDARYEIVSNVYGLNDEKVEIGKGCKGENLYKEIIDKYLTAFKEDWDVTKYEEEDMSIMYPVIPTGDENILDKVGYAYQDINVDGIDELLIGEIDIKDGDWQGVIYDIYTMVNRKPQHVVSGWDRNRYYALDGSFLLNEGSNGANETEYMVYDLVSNSKELFFQYGFKYDGNIDKDNPYFKSYDNNEENREWESITEEEFTELQKRVSNQRQIKYIPFTNIK